MITYKVDKKNKIVIAKLTHCEADVFREFHKRCCNSNDANYISNKTIEVLPTDMMFINHTYVGKCRFDKDEKLNKSLRKKKDKKRSMDKYYNSKEKMYNRIIKDLDLVKKELKLMKKK